MLDANAMDFDDLLMRTVNVLELFDEVRARYRDRFRWVLVDEYQDTNHAQYRLLQLLAGPDGNLMVVGDEDQSIYGFRQEQIRNILEFDKDFPEAHVVRLEQNYRLTELLILGRECLCLAQSAAPRQEPLDRGRRSEKITVAELDDEHGEARYVAGEIEELTRARSSATRSRSSTGPTRTAESSRTFWSATNCWNQARRFGGTKFHERAEIKDAVAYLNLIVILADEVSFSRAATLPRGAASATPARRVALARQHHRTHHLGGRARDRGGPRPRGRGRQTGWPFRGADRGAGRRVRERPRRRADAGAAGAQRILDSLRAERTIEAEAQWRTGGARRRRRRVRRQSRAGGRLRPVPAGGILAQGDFALHGRRQAVSERARRH